MLGLGLYKRAKLSQTVKTDDKRWEYFFCGLTIRQWGLGIVWRKKIPKELIQQKHPSDWRTEI